MVPPSVDLIDETFVVAGPAEVATYLTEQRLWQEWWPDLHLAVAEDRGREGVRWTVTGELSGTAEIWLEEWHDGVIVHYFLRAEPGSGTTPRAAARLRRRYATSFKARIHDVKDRLERGRPAGVPRRRAGL